MLPAASAAAVVSAIAAIVAAAAACVPEPPCPRKNRKKQHGLASPKQLEFFLLSPELASTSTIHNKLLPNRC